MSINTVMLKLVSVLLAAFFSTGSLAQEVPLIVSHRIIGSQPQSDGRTILTLELSVFNDGIDPLSDLSLRLMPGIPLLAGHEEPLALGAMDAGQIASVQWQVTSLAPLEGNGLVLQSLRFGAEANDSTGALLTFSVESTEVQP